VMLRRKSNRKQVSQTKARNEMRKAVM